MIFWENIQMFNINFSFFIPFSSVFTIGQCIFVSLMYTVQFSLFYLCIVYTLSTFRNIISQQGRKRPLDTPERRRERERRQKERERKKCRRRDICREECAPTLNRVQIRSIILVKSPKPRNVDYKNYDEISMSRNCHRNLSASI